MLKNIIIHHELISSFGKKDLISKYRRTFLGLLWSFLNTLFMLVVYTIVFSTILNVRAVPVEGRIVPYGLFLFSGLVPWIAFSESIQSFCAVVLRNTNLVKKTLFPLEILPVVNIISGLVHSIFVLLVLLVAIFFLEHRFLRGSDVLLMLVLVPQILFTMGLNWFLAGLGVFIRDIRELVSIITLAWMFSTAIFYSISRVPEGYSTP